MGKLNLIALLQDYVLDHVYLKAEDHAVVRQICGSLGLGEAGLINDYLKEQVEAEAGMVYLQCKYEKLRDKLREKFGEYEAGKSIELGDKTDEGYKWTKDSRSRWLLATDAQYAEKKDVVRKAERLLTLIRGLGTIVFDRPDKLEQLAINYRRESEADRRTTY